MPVGSLSINDLIELVSTKNISLNKRECAIYNYIKKIIVIKND